MSHKLHEDPQNKGWADDKGKFGYRMLMKMGWKDGKGLGSKEDGATDYIKVKKNIENRGIGAADVNTTNNWLANTVAFEHILAKLNTVYSSIESEPDKPKLAHPCRHFRPQRMLRSKSVENYSERDLMAIMGSQKERKTAAVTQQDEEKTNLSGVQTHTNAVSMKEYFKLKMSNQSTNEKLASTSAVESEDVKHGNNANGKVNGKSKPDKKRERRSKGQSDSPNGTESAQQPKKKRKRTAEGFPHHSNGKTKSTTSERQDDDNNIRDDESEVVIKKSKPKKSKLKREK